MNRLTRLLLGVLAPLALTATACDRNPDLVDPRPVGGPGNKGPAPNANPAICYVGESLAKNGSLLGYTIGVVDADGTDARNIYTLPSSGTTHTYAMPTWSPDRGSISFVERSTVSGVTTSTVKALDVTVTNGVPSATNVRTLLSRNRDFIGQAWSPSTTNAEVAFVQEQQASGFTEWSSIRLVSLSGAETVILAAQNDHSVRGIAWNPMGTKLAYHDIDVSGTTDVHSIKILDRATATIERTLVSGVHSGLLGLDWSRDGDSLVYFAAPQSGGALQMYTLSLADGATPREYSSVTGRLPSYSPNSLKAVFRGSTGLKQYDFMTATTTALLPSKANSGAPSQANWKR